MFPSKCFTPDLLPPTVFARARRGRAGHERVSA